MNRKRKKKMITTVALLLFFSAGGVWYLSGQESLKQQESGKELAGVLEKAVAEESLAPQEEASAEKSGEELLVYVCGAVNQPGVYSLAADSRLYEAVAAAGGFSAAADPAHHNLARTVTDGERIYILNMEETSRLTTEQQITGETGTSMEKSVSVSGLLNINMADMEQLMELPGIGEAKASAVIEYRTRVGQFKVVEEIMNVSGIGEAMFEKIKDKITVK